MPMNSRWKEKLDRILRSSQGRDPTELIEEIHELGAAMEPAEGEALLYANPHFLEHRPALQEARYEMVVRNEIAQSRQFLEQARDSPASFPEMANSFSVSIYSRTGDIFEHLNFGDCRRMILVGCGWMPVTLFHVHDKTDVPELVGLDIVPDAVATANELAKRLGMRASGPSCRTAAHTILAARRSSTSSVWLSRSRPYCPASPTPLPTMCKYW